MVDELVTLRQYTNPWEAEWARGVLASAGICCLIPDASVSYLYNFIGPVRVQVPSSSADDAEKVLADQEFSRKLLAPEREYGAEAAGEPGEGEGSCEPCPACGSETVGLEPAPPPGGESPSERLLRALTGPDAWVCSSCGHRWDRRTVMEESDDEATEAIDPHDLCPRPEPSRCPTCGSAASVSAPAPAYAGESALGGAFKRLLGHGWLRCSACGHLWED